MTRTRAGLVLALIATAALLAGCGGSLKASKTASQPATATDAANAANQSSASAISVIRGWSRALRSGNVKAAAAYFGLPSVFANGGEAVIVRTKNEARVVNESLSCGARLLSVTPVNGYFHAIFELTNRSGPGGGCGTGTGLKGATDFVISKGHIVHWIRAAVNEKPQPTPAPPANSVVPSQNV